MLAGDGQLAGVIRELVVFCHINAIVHNSGFVRLLAVTVEQREDALILAHIHAFQRMLQGTRQDLVAL